MNRPSRFNHACLPHAHPSLAGDLEDILGTLPEGALDSQAWEDYRPRSAAVRPDTIPEAVALPMVRRRAGT